MAKARVKVIKFGPQNKGAIIGLVGHTRTGACTAKGKCFHGRTHNRRDRGLRKGAA